MTGDIGGGQAIIAETRAEIAAAAAEGLVPLLWRMTGPAWVHLARALDPDVTPPPDWVGHQPPLPWLGLPILIVPGARIEWELSCRPAAEDE